MRANNDDGDENDAIKGEGERNEEGESNTVLPMPPSFLVASDDAILPMPPAFHLASNDEILPLPPSAYPQGNKRLMKSESLLSGAYVCTVIG